MAKAKQQNDEELYYSDFESLEVRIDENQEGLELMDCSDEALEERDYLDTMEFCIDLDANDLIDDDKFNFMEV
jgi:phosphosulfolactate phosphohydrolase-like enzyme